jgi:hypothetical protein
MIARMNLVSNTRKGSSSWNMNYLVMPSDPYSSSDIAFGMDGWMDYGLLLWEFFIGGI